MCRDQTCTIVERLITVAANATKQLPAAGALLVGTLVPEILRCALVLAVRNGVGVGVGQGVSCG